jgi:hypothetical protein
MIDYDPERARAAVQLLVDSSYYNQHIRKLKSAVERPRSMPFKGDQEPLNELLVIGRQNAQAMDNLLEVARFKRDDRNDYQRAYMAAKRKRDRKVILLEELLEARKLPHDHRVKVLARQYRVWNKERDQFLVQIGEVSWNERNTHLKAFWERKESELDQLIEEARARGPVQRSRKRVVVVKQEPKTALGVKLAALIKPR